MSRIYKDDETLKVLRIRPEGWVHDLVFEVENIHMCGQAEAGVGIRLSDERGGGVLTLDDMIAIQKMIAFHLKRVAKMVGGESDLGFEYEDFDDNDEDSSCDTASSPQRIKLQTKHTNSKGVTYYLNSKEVTLRGGKVQTIHYFTKEAGGEFATILQPDMIINENPRNGFLTIRRQNKDDERACEDE